MGAYPFLVRAWSGGLTPGHYENQKKTRESTGAEKYSLYDKFLLEGSLRIWKDPPGCLNRNLVFSPRLLVHRSPRTNPTRTCFKFSGIMYCFCSALVNRLTFVLLEHSSETESFDFEETIKPLEFDNSKSIFSIRQDPNECV
jgi:hypothetical protein